MICKQKLAELTKCYCVAGFDDDTGTHILVASEKDYPCYMFSLQGEREETLWETPGGVMSMVQVPGVKDCLLGHPEVLFPQRFQRCVYRRHLSGRRRVERAYPMRPTPRPSF